MIGPGADLDHYRVIVVPMLYLAQDGLAARLAQAAEDGAQVVLTYFSGIADATNRVLAGGYPGAYRDLIGAVVEEFHPLLAGEQRGLDNGWRVRHWAEDLRVTEASAVAHYVGGALDGRPAVTRRTVGRGTVTYLSTRPADEDVQLLVDELLTASGVSPVTEAPDGVEVVRRRAGAQSYLFGINHTGAEATIVASGRDLLTGADVAATVTVPAGGVVVVRES